MFDSKLIVLSNRGTDMMCQNTFGGKIIIFLYIIICLVIEHDHVNHLEAAM